MKTKISFPLREGCVPLDVYEVIHPSGEFMGEISKDEDCKYYYWPDENMYVHWTSEVLRTIANKLDELNAK